jgi:outer membrane protein OmpA-like peptidoglycan-associated protein
MAKLTSSHAPTPSEEAQWISLSDLMTGLMLIFMLLALTFMLRVESDARKNEQKKQQAAAQEEQARKIIYDALDKESKKAEDEARKIKRVAVLYDETRKALYDDLHHEFDKDLGGWGAEITPDLAVRFFDPDVLFATGQDTLKPKFQMILKDFFPRYVRIITSDKFKHSIQEIRIEGHTSSQWSAGTKPEDAYYKNMELSQSRTRSTLHFLLTLPEIKSDQDWLRSYMTANGLSSAHIIKNADGSEDAVRSQRVEFRLRTDAESKIEDILEAPAPKP